jgi:hypothetical protein
LPAEGCWAGGLAEPEFEQRKFELAMWIAAVKVRMMRAVVEGMAFAVGRLLQKRETVVHPKWMMLIFVVAELLHKVAHFGARMAAAAMKAAWFSFRTGLETKIGIFSAAGKMRLAAAWAKRAAVKAALPAAVEEAVKLEAAATGFAAPALRAGIAPEAVWLAVLERRAVRLAAGLTRAVSKEKMILFEGEKPALVPLFAALVFVEAVPATLPLAHHHSFLSARFLTAAP